MILLPWPTPGFQRKLYSSSRSCGMSCDVSFADVLLAEVSLADVSLPGARRPIDPPSPRPPSRQQLVQAWPGFAVECILPQLVLMIFPLTGHVRKTSPSQTGSPPMPQRSHSHSGGGFRRFLSSLFSDRSTSDTSEATPSAFAPLQAHARSQSSPNVSRKSTSGCGCLWLG